MRKNKIEEILNCNKNLARGFRNLEIWQMAIELYCLVYDALTKHPNISLKVKGQADNSAFPVHSNIAEGYTRRTVETHKFYVIALSSSSECYSQMYALLKSKQIDSSDFDISDKKSFELQNKIINMNKNPLSKIKGGTEWNSEY